MSHITYTTGYLHKQLGLTGAEVHGLGHCSPRRPLLISTSSPYPVAHTQAFPMCSMLLHKLWHPPRFLSQQSDIWESTLKPGSFSTVAMSDQAEGHGRCGMQGSSFNVVYSLSKP